jgi:hypothetical protein
MLTNDDVYLFYYFWANSHLDSNGLCNGSKDTKWQFRFVTTMSPQSMCSARNSESAKQKQEEGCIEKFNVTDKS